MTIHFGRATTSAYEWLASIPKSVPHAVASHPVDSGCNRDHIHFILETELSEKNVRKQIRLLSGLTATNDIALVPFDPNEDWPRYMLKNPKCKFLYANDRSDIGKKLVAQSLIEFPKPVAPSEIRYPTMQERLNKIYDLMSSEQTSEIHQNFSSFAEDLLHRYYKGHVDNLVPGEGSINAFKSYIFHLWGLYIENHIPSGGTFQDRLRKNYVRLLFGQAVVPLVHDAPCL